MRINQKSINLKSVLLFGSTSFTGSHILNSLQDRYSFRTVGRVPDSADITFDVYNDDIHHLCSELEWADIVINCFSNGDVDSCELNPGLSAQINLEFPKQLCQLQIEYNFHLIHFSSNAVYDGTAPCYSEKSAHHPINIYGNHKSEADIFLRNHSDRLTLLRPITMFGELLGTQRHNPFSFFYERIKNHLDINAVNDVYVNMLHIDVLINCIAKVIDQEIYDEFNICGDNIVSRSDFVSEIKRLFPASRSVITEVESSNFKTVARRPLNTSFDNQKMKSQLDVYPVDLKMTIEHLVNKILG